MDTVSPKPEKADATTYAWHEASPEEKAEYAASTESPRTATLRRLATAAGVGLVAAAVLTARGLKGANARAGENVIDYDD